MTFWVDAAVAVRGGEVAAQTLGDADAPAVVLLGGATWSRDWWPGEFCRTLVNAGIRVIRFDPRETGASTLSPPGAPDYDAGDLSEDVVAVLDAFGVRTATLIGLSAGGGIAQEVAARHPDRVAGVVLMSTTAAGDVGEELPGPTAVVSATFTDPPAEPEWTDRDAVTAWVVASERPYAGRGMFDEDEMRRITGEVWDRTPSMASASNHFLVVESSPAIAMVSVRDIPSLVVHGSADPLFPLPHGEALATYLDAPLLVLDGVGHHLAPPSMWPDVVRAIADLVQHEPSSR
jgi:pimeloyl-ACP methyl ester carboxylesterase